MDRVERKQNRTYVRKYTKKYVKRKWKTLRLNETAVLRKSSDVVVPEEYEAIGKEAFRNCQITSLTLPYGLKEIGEDAFRKSMYLKEVKLPNSVIRLGNGCFAECCVLHSITMSDKLKEIPENAFDQDKWLLEVHFTKNSQIQRINNSAFYECTRLENIQLPPKLTEIGDWAFRRCRELKHVKFPKGLKTIGMKAFYFCGLESLELPDTVEVPESIRILDRSVFHGCSRLKVLEIRHDPEFIGEEIVNSGTHIRCYQGSKVDAYCQEHGYITEYIE